MSEDTPEYTTHNFSAVDKQILEIAKREKARTFAYQLKSGLSLWISNFPYGRSTYFSDLLVL